MKTIIGVVLLAIAVLWPVRAYACKKCYSYFDYQSLEWCKYCDVSRCGYFTCDIMQQAGIEWCATDGEGCFEYGGWCEPEMQTRRLNQPLRPGAEWRLIRTRIEPRAADEKAPAAEAEGAEG